MEISALTRSVVKRNHAIIAPDGYINSNIPGWTNCTVNIIINEAMGAKFSQLLTTLKSDGEIKGETNESQIFFYVVKGKCHAAVGGKENTLTKGHYIYVPIGTAYKFTSLQEDTQLLSFHKVYEPLAGYQKPGAIFGKSESDGDTYLGDPAVRDVCGLRMDPAQARRTPRAGTVRHARRTADPHPDAGGARLASRPGGGGRTRRRSRRQRQAARRRRTGRRGG